MNETPRLLGGRYEVGETIGTGGMAQVLAGHDARLGRTVAVKMLRSDLARDPAFLARFRREAQAAAGLNHPAIVAVYDSGEDQETDPSGARVSVPYIVMEYVHGHTARDLLRQDKTLEESRAALITEGVLAALAYSHRMGIIHRDIKPANIMVTDTGAIKVMDFGIARAIADTNATMTQTQSVIGTAQYLSPEQAQGQQVDARSDLYSTGCLLYELLTGRPPFVGDSPVAVAYQHVRELPAAPSTFQQTISANMDAVVLHSLAKEREARYQTADQFRDDLQAARLGHPISTAARGTAAGMAGAATQPVDAVSAYDKNGNTATLPAIGRDPEEIPRKRHVATYTLLALAVVAALVLVVLAGRALLGDGAARATSAVPNVVNMTQAQATLTLTAAGFTPQVSLAVSTVDKGVVFDQNPPAGEQLPADGVVVITVSSGPDTVAVPDVTNFTQESATQALLAVGLKVGNVEQVDVDATPEIGKGKVVETNPKAGQPAPTDSAVTLRVSTGKVTVPDVVGRTLSDAQTTLDRLKLRTDTSFRQSTSTEGTVIEQSDRNKKVDLGTEISLVIAQPPAPTVTATTVTASPTPQPTTTTSGPTNTTAP